MIPEPLRRLAWSRSNGRCEYCQMPQALDDAVFEIDHIIAEKHGGLTESGNLALACFGCNAHKGPNIAGIDPLTGELCRLFHPRNDVWTEHFSWQQAVLEGLNSGRAYNHSRPCDQRSAACGSPSCAVDRGSFSARKFVASNQEI